MNKFLIAFFLLFSIAAKAQNSGMVKIFNTSDHQKPLLVYFSGDGGFNSFTNALLADLSGNGYDIVAINSKSYFWRKKTPQQTAAFIQPYLQKYLPDHKLQSFVLIGYSFGADVMPFVYNNLSTGFAKSGTKIILLAPSPTTDFEVHMLDMAGGSGKYNMDVVAEINKIKNVPVYMISSSKSDFPVNNIKSKNICKTILNGSFHFDKDPKVVLPVIYKSLN
ncbi:MAG: AcvB/VirJ family lysyl-phosphatidylglycerol hydrolase [Niabella sp.]